MSRRANNASGNERKERLKKKKAKLLKLQRKLKEIMRTKEPNGGNDEIVFIPDHEDLSFEDIASSTHHQSSFEFHPEPNQAVLKTFRFVLRELLQFIDAPDCELENLFSDDDWSLTNDVMPKDRIETIKSAADGDKLDVFFAQLEDYKLHKIQNSNEYRRSAPVKRSLEFQQKVKQIIGNRLTAVSSAVSSNVWSPPPNPPRPILSASKFSVESARKSRDRAEAVKRKWSETSSQAIEPLQKLVKWADELRNDNEVGLADKLLELSSGDIGDTVDNENNSALSNSIIKFATDQVMNNWHFNAFIPSEEQTFIVGDFRRYIEKFNMYAKSVGCRDDQKQVLLQFKSGDAISKAFDAIVSRGKTTFSSFQDVVNSLIEYWSRGVDNTAVETFFKSQKQKDGQSYTDYLEQLRNTSYNVTTIFSQVNPVIAQENMILHTFAAGVRDESLQRFANELAVSTLKVTTKMTNRLDRLENKTIAADKNLAAPQNMFEVKRVVDAGPVKQPFKGENERSVKFNSTVPGAPRGRGLMRNFGYRQADGNRPSFQHRQYRGQSHDYADKNEAQFHPMQVHPNVCLRCKQPGHRFRQVHLCPLAGRQPTPYEMKGQYITESFARPQSNMFAQNAFNKPSQTSRVESTRPTIKSEVHKQPTPATNTKQNVNMIASGHEEVSDDVDFSEIDTALY